MAESRSPEPGSGTALPGLACLGLIVTGVAALMLALFAITGNRGGPSVCALALLASALAWGLLANALLRD
jgi:TctA family transporter